MTTDYSQVPIIQGAYQLALDTQRLVARFPKNFRFQIGDRLAWMTQDFFEATVKANFIRDAALRWKALDALSAEVFTIRMTVRMAKDLKTISNGQYTEVISRVEDLHKQLTGWTKWTQSKIPRGTGHESHHQPS